MTARANGDRDDLMPCPDLEMDWKCVAIQNSPTKCDARTAQQRSTAAQYLVWSEGVRKFGQSGGDHGEHEHDRDGVVSMEYECWATVNIMAIN